MNDLPLNEKLLQLNRIYAIISRINQAIVRIRDKKELLQEMCDIVIQHGKFRMSWIGMVNTATLKVEPVAWSGIEEGYLDNLNIAIDESPEANGPTGRVIKEDADYIACLNYTTDPSILPWRERALARGYLASISLPVKIAGKTIGAFTIYADSVNTFGTQDEVDLLKEVAANISFGLEQFELEEKYKKNEQLVRKLSRAVEQSASSIVITNLDGNIEYVNPAFSQLTGYSKEEALGNNPRILKTGYTSPDSYKNMWELLSHGNVWHGVFCNKKKNGEIYWESATISPITDECGKVTNYVAIKENITEMKRLEEELKQQNAKLNTIYKSTPAFICEVDQEGLILSLNRRGLGLPVEGLLGVNITKIFSESYHTQALEILEDVFQHKATRQLQHVPCFYEGETIVLSMVIAPIIQNDKVTAALITGIDTSELERKEKELRQSAYALRSFADHLQQIREEERAGIAKEIHDELGQSLTLLKLDAAWVKKNFDSDREFAFEKLNALIKNIEDTIQTSRNIYNKLNPQMLDTMGLEHSIKWHVANFSKLTGIGVVVDGSIQEDAMPKKMKLGIFRVLQESLTNVLRYAKAKEVHVSLGQDDKSFMMKIEDDGVGFDKTKVNTFQSHGLLGMRERIYALDGVFEINSSEGMGTAIQIEVPLTHVQQVNA
ncbi:MAG: PAS domain S-box protein [Bacteroidota bacterium]|nr:PAS domain S-box protein [Bacteroidota bacterium]